MRNWQLHFNFQIVILLGLGLAAYLLLPKYLNFKEPKDATALLTGIVGAIACFSAANFAHRADQRAMATNSFDIGRRWEREPLLEARDIIRGRTPDELVGAVKANDKEVKKSIIHLLNFFWEMSAAVETGWTLEPYLKEKFWPSLQHYHPAIVELLDYRGRPGASESMRAIDRLYARWRT